MNFGNSKKILIYALPFNYCRFFTVQNSINKCSSSANYLSKLYHRNSNHFSCFPFSKHISQTVLCNAPITVSQRRKFSNNVSDIKNANASILEPSAVTEAANLTASTPNFIRVISEWKIVELAQQTLLNVHEITGLPWWASIILTSFIARLLITLPFTLSQVFKINIIILICLKVV
jgi:membrane protein insertase Oxa1/YidC/SpoIIIJ